jgi:hypothetical protein
MSNNIQFRRGSKQDYDVIKASGNTDSHDIYLVGGEEHKDVIITTGSDGSTTTSYETKPLSIFVGGESVQTVLSSDIPVTTSLGANIKQGTTLSKGSSIEAILKQLLCNVMNPSLTAPNATLKINDVAKDYTNYGFIDTAFTMPSIKLVEGGGTATGTGWTPGSCTYQRSNRVIVLKTTNGFTNYEVTGANSADSSASTTTTIASTSITLDAGTNKTTIDGSFNYGKNTANLLNNVGDSVSNLSWASGKADATDRTIIVTGVHRIYSNGKYTTRDGDKSAAATSALHKFSEIVDNTTPGKSSTFKVAFGPKEGGHDWEIHVPQTVSTLSAKQWDPYANGGSYAGAANFVKQTETATHDNITYDVYKLAFNNIDSENSVQFTIKNK